MSTYLVVTQAPAGPRGRKITEKWIVVEMSPECAKRKALSAAHDDARAIECVLVENLQRVSVS